MSESARAKASQIKRLSGGTKRLYAVVNGLVVFC